MGAVQTGVLLSCALLESVASSVEKAAELRLSSLTEQRTLLITLCTSLVFGGTSVVLEGTSIVFEGILYCHYNTVSQR